MLFRSTFQPFSRIGTSGLKENKKIVSQKYELKSKSLPTKYYEFPYSNLQILSKSNRWVNHWTDSNLPSFWIDFCRWFLTFLLILAILFKISCINSNVWKWDIFGDFQTMYSFTSFHFKLEKRGRFIFTANILLKAFRVAKIACGLPTRGCFKDPEKALH